MVSEMLPAWHFGRPPAPAGAEPGIPEWPEEPEAELGLWSKGELVAIVRRHVGRTVEVRVIGPPRRSRSA